MARGVISEGGLGCALDIEDPVRDAARGIFHPVILEPPKSAVSGSAVRNFSDGKLYTFVRENGSALTRFRQARPGFPLISGKRGKRK